MKSVHTQQYSAFLALIIQARKNANVTQQELADRLDKPQSYVSKYEHGERRLDFVEVIEIAELIDLDPHELIDKLRETSPTGGSSQ